MINAIFGNDPISTIYYFFSTTAQVWAALIAFGGIGIRDRILSADRSMDDAFRILTDKIRWLSHPLNVDYHDDIFLNRENLSDYLEQRGTFENELKIVADRPNTMFRYRYGDRGDGGDIDRGKYPSHIRQILTYYAGYKASRSLRDSLKKELKLLVLWGLSLILVSILAIIVAKPLNGCPLSFLVVAGAVVASSIWLFFSIRRAFILESN